MVLSSKVAELHPGDSETTEITLRNSGSASAIFQISVLPVEVCASC